ncbi:MAG: hypothetical protein M3Z24_08605, partial [Chloroflexota bacterium]|nr:hypothetical protein [Chloroflexota bacterium]
MEQIRNQFQPIALLHDACYQLDSAQILHELEYLELLVPEISHTSARDLQTYALAYVEHYQDDVLQLEHEWKFLYGALLQAWQRVEYAVVVRLAISLAHPAGRLNNSTVAEHILHLGIAASRRTQDREHLACFLNRLGGLLFSHGKYQQGWRVWHTGLQVAASSGSYLGLWEPLSSFAQIADILGDYTTVQQFVETLLHTRWIDDPDSFAVIFFVRGFYARATNNLDRAYEDLSCCLRFLSCRAPDAPPSSYRQLFTMVVHAELARVQRNYELSQAYTETALSLAQLFSDHYTVAALLIDQVIFTYQQGQFADTHTAFLRLREVARSVEAPHPYKVSCFFE